MFPKILHVGVLAFSVLCAGSAFALKPSEIYDRAREASFEVLIEGRLMGSGWFASAEGRAFTAAHVVRGAPEGSITLRTRGRGELPAEVVALDPSHDLALLKISGAKPEGADLPFLTISEVLPEPGDIVFLFGSAYFRHEVMIRGAIARKEPTYEFHSGPRQYIHCMHISAPSPLGTSGGCWVDREGRVVGLQSAFLSKDGHGMGIAFSSEPGAIRELLSSGKTKVAATLGCGLEETLAQPKAFLSRFPKGIRGLIPVLRVKDGPADSEALKGDLVITHLDGNPVPMRDPFLDAIRGRRPGDKVTLTIVRPSGAKPSDVVVTLGGL